MDEEEVELRDYINILVKRKKLIIGVTLIAILISGLLSYFVLPPVYKGSAIILPPRVGENFLTGFTPLETQSIIKDTSFLTKMQIKTNIPYSDLSKGISVSVPQGANFVKVEFESVSKGDIQKFFSALIDGLNETSSLPYEKKLNFLKTNIIDYENQLKILNEEEKRILERIESLSKSKDTNYEIGLLVLENIYNSIINSKISVENQLKDLKYQLDNTHPFVYLSDPYVLDTPVKPNKTLNIAIAGVSALFFSVLLAFFLEYLESNKDDEQSNLKP